MRALVALAALSLLSCTTQKLIPVVADAPKDVDDLLEVDADFCTSPASDVSFPVKLLLVVDASGSMQFTDQPGLRVNAILQLVNSLQAQKEIFVSTMAFGSNVYQDPPIPNGNGSGGATQIFQPIANWTEPSFLTLKDVTTDYQGTLEAVKQTLLQDMLNTSKDELARTKYVVIWFSDGAPDPLCCIQADAQVGAIDLPFGCQPESWETPDPNTVYCEGIPENNICLVSAALDNFRNNVQGVVGGSGQPNYGSGVTQAVAGLKVDANYNRIFQIEQEMRDIVKFGKDFGVGELQFNTALLDDPTLSDVVKSTFELNSCREKGLLQDMATIGNGQFRDFSNSQSIDFLSFDFTSLKQEFTLIDNYAVNFNALPPGGDPKVLDYRPDSDGDGLDDDTEFQIGTIAFIKDSDNQAAPLLVGQVPNTCDPSSLTDTQGNPCSLGDGFDDNFEHQRENIGFDPRVKSLPIESCPVSDPVSGVDQSDLDGDGLNGCEEAILGTDPTNPDSDGDSLPDGLEVRIGLDPLIAEADRDDDFDGTPNLDEVRKGRDPHVPDSIREQTSVRYELIETGHTEDGRTCYTSNVRGIHLATTVPRFSGGRSGYNDIFYYLVEAPNGSSSNRNKIRVACVRVQYIKPNFKDPEQGIVHLKEADFVDIADPRLTDPTDPDFPLDLCSFNGKGLEVK